MQIIPNIRVFLRAIALVLLLLLFLIFYLFSLIFTKHYEERAFRLRRNWIKIAIIILGLRIQKEGTVPKKVGLFISNHRSFSDPIVVCRYLDAFVIAKAEVKNMPFISKGASLTGVIYVKREDQSSRKQTRKVMIDTLAQGYNVLVYPEGTVSAGPKTIPFKNGTFQEAHGLGIPVFPIAIEYSAEVDLWEKKSFLSQFYRQFRKRKTSVKIRFGKEIEGNDGMEIAHKTRTFIDQSLEDMQLGWSEIYGAH